jgi:hypothetical protein
MRDPVLAADGHTYERATVERCFSLHGPVSPLTGAPLSHTQLIPNQVQPLPPPSSSGYCDSLALALAESVVSLSA